MGKSAILLGMILFLGAGLCFAQGTDDLTLTTYYPSPYGVYGTLRLYPTGTVPVTCAEGELFYDDGSISGQPGVYWCDDSDAWHGSWLPAAGGFWAAGTVANSIYYTTLTGKVGIGTDTPLASFHVKGDDTSPPHVVLDTEILAQDDDSVIQISGESGPSHLILSGSEHAAIGKAEHMGLHYWGLKYNYLFTIGHKETNATNWDTGGPDGWTNYISIVNDGHVGIGTTVPSTGDKDLLLDVEGPLGATDICDEDGNHCHDLSVALGGGITVADADGSDATSCTQCQWQFCSWDAFWNLTNTGPGGSCTVDHVSVPPTPNWAKASCPAGWRVITGGGICLGGLRQSRPDPITASGTLDAWYVEGMNSVCNQVSALCCH